MIKKIKVGYGIVTAVGEICVDAVRNIYERTGEIDLVSMARANRLEILARENLVEDVRW